MADKLTKQHNLLPLKWYFASLHMQSLLKDCKITNCPVIPEQFTNTLFFAPTYYFKQDKTFQMHYLMTEARGTSNSCSPAIPSLSETIASSH